MSSWLTKEQRRVLGPTRMLAPPESLVGDGFIGPRLAHEMSSTGKGTTTLFNVVTSSVLGWKTLRVLTLRGTERLRDDAYLGFGLAENFARFGNLG